VGGLEEQEMGGDGMWRCPQGHGPVPHHIQGKKLWRLAYTVGPRCAQESRLVDGGTLASPLAACTPYGVKPGGVHQKAVVRSAGKGRMQARA